MESILESRLERDAPRLGSWILRLGSSEAICREVPRLPPVERVFEQEEGAME